MIVVIIAALWFFGQIGNFDTPDDSRPVTSTSDSDAPSQAVDVPVVKVTPQQLYQSYTSNEVATDQALAGKVIQVTAPVKSIDKDFTDSAVLHFATGNEFGEMGVTLEDSQKAMAAQLSRGEVVTVQCKRMVRILTSPMGSDCVFVEGTKAPAH